MQIEALRICNLSISRCSPLALAFQGERGNNRARINPMPMQGVEKTKKKKEEEKTVGSRQTMQWLVFTVAAVAAALPPEQHLPSHRGVC